MAEKNDGPHAHDTPFTAGHEDEEVVRYWPTLIFQKKAKGGASCGDGVAVGDGESPQGADEK